MDSVVDEWSLRGCGGESMFRNSASFSAPLKVNTVRSTANRRGPQKWGRFVAEVGEHVPKLRFILRPA